MTLLDEPKAGAADSSNSTARGSRGSRSGLWPLVLALLAAVVRAAVAAASGLVLAVGLALLVWALTPASGSGPVSALGVGAAFFAAAHGMPIRLGTATLTLPPLLLTAIGAALLAAAVRRGRFLPSGRGQEAAVAGIAALTYGLVVALAPAQLGAGALVSAGQWWRPVLVATVVAGVAVLTRGARPNLGPGWVGPAIRLGAVGAAGLIGVGAIAVMVGLGASFSLATGFAETTAPGSADGIGLLMLGVVFLPNAVLAGTGYSSGIGFTIGGGLYSPLGTHAAASLPQLPILAAVPQHSGVAASGLALLAGPLLVAVVLGRGAVRRLADRSDRIRAAAVASAVTGVALGVVAWFASGGVTPGPWSAVGVAAVPFALVVTVELAIVSVAVAAVAQAAPAVSPDEDEPQGDTVREPAGRRRPRISPQSTSNGTPDDTDVEPAGRRRRTSSASGSNGAPDDSAASGSGRARRRRASTAAASDGTPADPGPDTPQLSATDDSSAVDQGESELSGAPDQVADLDGAGETGDGLEPAAAAQAAPDPDAGEQLAAAGASEDVPDDEDTAPADESPEPDPDADDPDEPRPDEAADGADPTPLTRRRLALRAGGDARSRDRGRTRRR